MINITGNRLIDTMLQLTPLLILPFLTYLFQQSTAISDDTEFLRPQFHLTPDYGWANDPNGLFYDRKEKLWHAYFQHNPDTTVWALPIVWGHSTSKDLLTWEYHGVAIEAAKDTEGIYSGSIIVDRNNTSGFFNESIDPEQRVVAIYTNNIPEKETQDIAYSLDAGYSFIKYDQNPVIDVNSTQQRDPKVFWHDETQTWIMVVAKTQEYKVQIYSSSDLKQWDLKSNFTGGYLGYQYECPGLFKLPIDNPQEGGVTEKWVLLFAINPGSPIGGSINEYFIGDFDGVEFKADDNASRFMDLGKDFYAFQSFDNVEPEDGVLGLAWASNWQYANIVPTNEWRSSMTLTRKYSLKYADLNPETESLVLVQKPVFETKETALNESLKTLQVVNEYEVTNLDLDQSSYIATDFNSVKNSTGTFDFNLTFTLTDLKLGNSNTSTTFGIYIHSQLVKGTTETIQIVFDALSTTWYIDRSTQSPFQRNSPIFQERMSQYVERLDTTDTGYLFDVYGIVDHNILELYLNDGTTVLTNTFFFSEGRIPSSVEVVSDSEVSFITIDELLIRELGLK